MKSQKQKQGATHQPSPTSIPGLGRAQGLSKVTQRGVYENKNGL